MSTSPSASAFRFLSVYAFHISIPVRIALKDRTDVRICVRMHSDDLISSSCKNKFVCVCVPLLKFANMFICLYDCAHIVQMFCKNSFNNSFLICFLFSLNLSLVLPFLYLLLALYIELLC